MLTRTYSSPLNGRAASFIGIGAALALTLPLLQHSPILPGTASFTAPNPYTLPLRFEPNKGQAPASALYTAHMKTGTITFGRSGFTMLQSTGATGEVKPVEVNFVGAQAANVTAEHPDGARANYFIGSDPAAWRTGLPTYNSVVYNGLYPGIVAEYTGTEGTLKGTYTVAAGTDPSVLRWRYAGTRGLTTDSGGNLQIGLPAASGAVLREFAPSAWQTIKGKHVAVAARYAVGSDSSVGFSLGEYNKAYPLTIDPAITFSTYLGGSGTESALAVAADASGNTYVTGQTASTNFPVQNAMQPTNAGTGDAFVAKFNADGTLAFSTYLGGLGDDVAYSVKVDGTGNIYVGGRTASNNFPTHNAYRSTGAGSADAFLTKLTNDGQTLLYSTYVGGAGAETGWGVAIDGTGGAYIYGTTQSTNFPTRNAYQAASGGGYDAFLTRLDTNASGDASLIYSTYFGGSGDDYGGGRGVSDTGHGVAADASGNVYITGDTVSPNFPMRNAYQSTSGGVIDAFAAKLNTNVSGDASLLYSTYLGGNQTDRGRDIAVDGAGNAYVTGEKGSANFPSRNGYASCGAANTQPFVAKFNMAVAGDASLVYLTCFNSTSTAMASQIAVDSSGNAVIAGYTGQGTWPLVSPIMTWSGSNDAILTRLNSTGNALIYSTYLGGTSNDYAYGMALDGAGHVYVAGETLSSDFPTQAAFQGTNHGQSDAFITKIDEGLTAPTPTATLSPTPRPSATPSPTPGCTVNFSDVHPTDYFYTAVTYLYCHGAISGYSDGSFRPYNNTTRGQLSKIVVLAEGWPINTAGGPHFSDVPTDSTFYAYIETAYSHGIISGYGDGSFRPGNSITRGQLSKIVVLAQGWTLDTSGGPHFTDVPTSNSFYVYIETAFHHGVISGYGDGTFRWGNTATRGQICKIVYMAVAP